MIVLGRFYTRTLVTLSDQTLVRREPYRRIRHPGYLGSLLVWVGASLALAPPPIAAMVAVILIRTYARRIRHEEHMLSERFGPACAAYCERSWRLVPFAH